MESSCWEKCLVICVKNLMLEKVPGELREKPILGKVPWELREKLMLEKCVGQCVEN